MGGKRHHDTPPPPSEWRVCSTPHCGPLLLHWTGGGWETWQETSQTACWAVVGTLEDWTAEGDRQLTIKWNISIRNTTGTQLAVLYREVSLIQRWICTKLYVVGTADSVFIKEVTSIQYGSTVCMYANTARNCTHKIATILWVWLPRDINTFIMHAHIR